MKVAPKSGKGEIIVLYENGISPVKRPNPAFRSLPRFYPRWNPVAYANVIVNGQVAATTGVLHDIESTAIQNLDDNYAGLIAKQIAGVVVKEGVAYEVEKATKSPLAGFLTRVVTYAADQADLRSWYLLPKDLQLARIAVDPGTYQVGVAPVGAYPLPAKTVQVGAGKKIFVDFRYIP